MKLSKAGALAKLEEIGKDVKIKAQPTHWPYEKMNRAKAYEAQLPIFRQAYAAISQDWDIVNTLTWLLAQVYDGVHHNGVSLMLKAARGELHNEFWQVIDGHLTFVK